jgi:peptidyl-prolyl cis-trans isomerase C
MNLKNASQIFVISCFLAACSGDGKDPGAAAPGASGELVATINGEPLTAPMLEVYARGRGLDPADPASRNRALDALIENVLLAQDAKAKGLTDRPEVQAELELVRLQQLAGRALSEMRSAAPVTDAEVRAYYDRESARTGNIELNLQHILFADEAAATAANERALAADADFAALMAQYAAQGAIQARDLGWGNLTQMPPELAEAAQRIPDGQVAPMPVQTSFGWHVFKRAASRPFTPPPFEQVEAGARKQLVDQKLADKVRALRTDAKIEMAKAGASGA